MDTKVKKAVAVAAILCGVSLPTWAADWTKEPGHVSAEWKDGKVVWTVEGYADIAAKKPMTRDALFWAASNTKAVGAALVLTYVDEGKIELDAPVERYFPQWAEIEVVQRPEGAAETRHKPPTKPTVRQLLSHMSGLAFFPEMPIDRYSMKELVDVAVARGLASDPGTKFTYSNWGIDVAVAIAEKVGGRPWEVLLQERVLGPLDMTGATFWPTEAEQARLVVPYHFPEDGGAPVRGNGVTQFSPDVANRDLRHAEAGGGLYMTADDFLKFFAMVANHGVGLNGKRVLSEKTCRECYRRQTPKTVKDAYSFGFFVDEEKGTVMHDGAYATHGEADWKNRTCAVRLVQKCGRPAGRRPVPVSVYGPKGLSVEEDAISLLADGEEVWRDDLLSTNDTWRIHCNYGDQLKFIFGGEHRRQKGLVVHGFKTNKVDSAWSIRTKMLPLTVRGSRFIVEADVSTDRRMNPGSNNESHGNGIYWFDASGKRIGAEPFNLCRKEGDWGPVRYEDKIPEGATQFVLQLGFDGPNLWDGAETAYRNVRVKVIGAEKRYAKKGTFTSEFVRKGALAWRGLTPTGTSIDVVLDEKDAPAGYCRYVATLTSDGSATPKLTAVTVGGTEHAAWTKQEDEAPPCIVRTSPSPSTDRNLPLAFDVSDASVVDWSTLAVKLDGADATAQFVREGDRLVQKTPVAPWKDGLHTCDITLGDVRGNKATARKRFFLGESGKTPKVTLRDDGVTLVDGEPYFPIGMYGVMRREFNGNDFGKAFDGLVAGGFNTSHSYSETFDASYLEEAGKHGFKYVQFGRLPDHRMMTKSRFDPNVLAWYLGDDTAVCEKWWELLDYDEGMRAVDPNRLTCQADLVWGYPAYAQYTDVFLPELYPMNKDDEATCRKCAAQVTADMRKIAADNARYGGERTHAVWGIVQYFKGWGWGHFPTKDELYAMTFASLCNGARGMFWYAYCGVVDPEKKKFNYGVTSTPERWETICALATRLKKLTPILLERDLPCMKPAFLKGPGTDPFGHEPVSVMLKRHGNARYLFAVNTAPEEVTVRYPIATKRVDVADEKRSLPVASDGFIDTLAPFAVRLYRLAE